MKKPQQKSGEVIFLQLRAIISHAAVFNFAVFQFQYQVSLKC